MYLGKKENPNIHYFAADKLIEMLFKKQKTTLNEDFRTKALAS